MEPSATTLAAWREQVRRETGGEGPEALATPTADGLRIEPLATELDLPADVGADLAGESPWRRGTTASPRDPAISVALRGGAAWGGLAARLAGQATGGSVALRVPRGEDPAPILAAAPEAALTLECGGDVLPAVAWALAGPQRRIAADPLGALAATGALPRPLAQVRRELAAAARRLGGDPAARPLEISTVPYHEAGAGEALELGLALAANVEALRWLEAEGLEPAAAAPAIGWSLALGRDLFLQVAKLRAARLLWAKLLAACGVEPLPPPRLRAVVSRRTWTRLDPWVNVLRGTTQVFAALVGGAEEISPLPFDLLTAEASDLGARLALNTVRILSEEGLVGRTLDPGGGAYAIEAMTDAVARRAWEELIWVEGAGGLTAALMGGALAARLEGSWSEQQERFARHEEEITGVTAFRALGEPPPAGPSRVSTPEAARVGSAERTAAERLPSATDPEVWIDEASAALRGGVTLTQLAVTLPGTGEGPQIEPLPSHRDAEAFEPEP